jgi:hypothetical protein
MRIRSGWPNRLGTALTLLHVIGRHLIALVAASAG